MNQTTSSNWKAWHDFMPGSEPTLHVTGQVTAPTTGYSASLVPHTPQGINPAIYIFDLIVIPPNPNQVVHQTVTTFDVSYEEDTRKSYSHVTILPDNIMVEVTITS
jgi:hypothetical protein